jgi:hypothetical protein
MPEVDQLMCLTPLSTIFQSYRGKMRMSGVTTTAANSTAKKVEF